MKIEKLLQQAEQLVVRLQIAQAEQAKIKQRQQELQAAGMLDASPYWNPSGYLYVTGRMRQGERAREYIGKDADKVREALAKIERFKEHEELDKSLSDWTNATQRIEYSLSEAHSALSAASYRNGKAKA